MTGFIIALAMVTTTTLAMVIDMIDLHNRVKEQNRQYNELKKRL